MGIAVVNTLIACCVGGQVRLSPRIRIHFWSEVFLMNPELASASNSLAQINFLNSKFKKNKNYFRIISLYFLTYGFRSRSGCFFSRVGSGFFFKVRSGSTPTGPLTLIKKKHIVWSHNKINYLTLIKIQYSVVISGGFVHNQIQAWRFLVSD